MIITLHLHLDLLPELFLRLRRQEDNCVSTGLFNDKTAFRILESDSTHFILPVISELHFQAARLGEQGAAANRYPPHGDFVQTSGLKLITLLRVQLPFAVAELDVSP